MNTSQKTAKYLGFTFAILLAILIILSIMGAGYFTLKGLNVIKDSDNDNNNQMDVVSSDGQLSNSILNDVEHLYIDSDFGKVIIKQGNGFNIQYENNDNIKIENNSTEKKCVIKNEKKSFFNWSSSDITITIPTNYKFKTFSAKSGAGTLSVYDIKTDRFVIENGAGKINCENIIALDSAKIDGGAGEIIISNSALKDADMDTGVGFTKYEGSLSGDCKIDHGLGELIINLSDKENDFNYIIKKGLGEISLNSNSKSDINIENNASSNLKISGGVGRIEINTAQ